MKNADALLLQLRQRDRFVDFARLKSAGNTQQTKNCTKGWPCGNTCLSRTKKNCKKALDGQSAELGKWLEKGAKAAKGKGDRQQGKKPALTVIKGGKKPPAEALTELEKDPKTAKFIALMATKTTDKKIREALDIDQTEALKLFDQVRRSLGVSATQNLRDRLKELKKASK